MKKYKFSIRRAIEKMKAGMNRITCVGVELLKESPIMRMYFDSELGSPIEQTVEIALASSVAQTILNVLPKTKLTSKLASAVGTFVARKETWALDRAKLTYQFSREQIDFYEYNEELIKRQVSTLVAAADMAKHGLNATVAAFSVTVGMNPLMVKSLLEGFTSNIHLPEDIAKKILKNGKILFSEAVDAIDSFLEDMQDRASEVYQKTKAFAEHLAAKVAMKWRDIKDKAKNGMKKIGLKVVAKSGEVLDAALEIINKIKNR